MTSEMSRDWATSRGTSSQHSEKKPAFTPSRFEMKGSNDDNDSLKNVKIANTKFSPKSNASDSEKEHTVIDIENVLSSSKAVRDLSRSRRSKTVSTRKANNSETDESSEEEKNRLVDIQNGNENLSDTTGESQLVISKSKKTSAMILAEDNSLSLRSPMMRQGTIWNCVAFCEPRIWTKEEWDKWSKCTFYPSRYSGPDFEKTPNDIETRIADDEGLFVSEPVPLSKNNLNMLKWRLFTENSNYWFDSNGKLFCFPNPYRPDPIQPFNDEETSTELNSSIVFVPTRLDAFEKFKTDANHQYEIEIDLGYINFTHHPFFSKEHFISTRLQDAFEDYSQRRLNKLTERAVNKLKALREAVAHTKTTLNALLQEIENDDTTENNTSLIKETISQNRERLIGYRNEIRRSTLARDRGYWDDKASLAAVLDAWKDLKNIRGEQGYVNTSIKLNIIELPSDPKEEMEMWLKEIGDDLQDIKDETTEIFEIEMSKYRAKMKRWTNKRRSRKGSGQSENATDNDSDISISRRPKLPIKPDIQELENMLERRYKDVKRRPGEPNVVLDLVRTASITATNQLPEGATKEKQRRRVVRKCQVEVRLWLNGMEIYISKARNINSDFSVFLGFSVPISFRERPERLEIEVVELESSTKTFRVTVPLPKSDITIERCQMQTLTFFSEDVTKISHDGVGSGVPFEILGKEYNGSYTKGNLTIRCGWSMDVDGNIKCPKEIGSPNLTDEGGERKLSNNSQQLDPNNPKYASFHASVGKLTDGTLISMKYSTEDVSDENGFNLDKYMEEFEFCKMESIDKSARFRILQLRDQGVPEFKNSRMISPFEKDISNDTFLIYERRLKEALRKGPGKIGIPRFGKKKLMEDDIVYESNRLEKIREIRLGVLQLFEKSLKQITFEDFVLEEQIPDIGTLGLNLMSFFQPRRPLRPLRKERKRIQASNLVDTKIDLIFNIVRAFNLPLRKDTDVGLLTTESVTGIQLARKRPERTVGNYSTIRPFVEIWFQRKVVRTTTAVGSNPTWNQELQLNLTVPNDDYTQANLSKMDDLAFLLVYDEVAVDLLDDERRRDTDIYQRVEKRWLGSIGIPFSTLYTNGRIEGTFKLNMPPILLGYEAQGMGVHFAGLNVAPRGSALNATTNDTKISVGSPFNNQKNAFITIFITLQPAVQPTISPKEDSASGESPDMMAYVKIWKNTLEKCFPERCLKPFVMTADGDTILCTRYLKAIQPPDSFLNPEAEIVHVMEDLAHYVSLFPFVRDSTLGITDYSLWFTADVFIMTPGGGVDDHAVLLACFFMHFNVPCWIVQGNAIPDGPSTFVVTSFKGMDEAKGISKTFKNVVLIWNPCSGEYFNANDNFCPLQKVWSAIGKHNIWANVSDGERPHQIDWDIEKSKSWQPMFTKSVAEDKIPCVQNGVVKYKPADQIQANSLAQRIERHLKDAFMKWRTTSKTNWNRYCSATLRRLLPKLEEMKSGRSRALEVPGSGSIECAVSVQSGSVVSVNEEHLMELREVMTSYQMSGFPLQQPYVNMETIIETVFATGVHTIDTPDVEFGLAAYAHAYPASVYSVWIYVAALHRRK